MGGTNAVKAISGSSTELLADGLDSAAESAAKTNPWKKECLLADLQRAATLDMAAEAKRLNLADTEKMFSGLGSDPTIPVRRTFEAVCLLLGVASVAPADLWCTNTSSPEIASTWARQKMKKIIGDASLKERLGEFVKREEEMRAQPGLALFIANTYFREEAHRAYGFEMLTHGRVLTSSQNMLGKSKGEASPAVIMFNWCVAMLTPELQAIVDELTKQEEAEEAMRKDEEDKAAQLAKLEARRIEEEENAKRREAEEEVRRIDAEAKQKQEEELKAKAEAEAVRKAAEKEAKEREEEVRRKNEAEAKEKAELEAKLRAKAAAEEAEKAKTPDRCFEIHVMFPAGSADLSSDQEMPLQTVAATVCMRQQLSLQIISYASTDDLDIVKRRTAAVQSFLMSNGVLPSAISSSDAKKADETVCRVALCSDAVLIEHFRAGRRTASDPEVQDIVEWLQENFKTVML